MNCQVDPCHLCCGDNMGVKIDPTYSDNKRGEFHTFIELARLEYTKPQPHFKPGYTGYTPGRVEHMLGKTYGQYINELLNSHPVAGSRLSRIPGDYVIPGSQDQPPDTRDNPHSTLEPHFVPGYTGFTPGSGIRRSEGFGQTYGRMTHIKLAKHFLRGSRLRPIFDYPAEYVAKEEDDKFYSYEHELTRDNIKRRVGLMPGYAGHVPRAVFRHGKNGTKIAEEAIAEFQKIINK